MTLSAEQCVAANKSACMNDAARASAAGGRYDGTAAAACAGLDVKPLFDTCHVPQLNSSAYARALQECAGVHVAPLKSGAECQEDLQCGADPGFVAYCKDQCEESEIVEVGAGCRALDAECVRGSFCGQDGTCTATLVDGASCTEDEQCASANCEAGKCASKAIDANFCQFFLR
jgi:hypothetical protein